LGNDVFWVQRVVQEKLFWVQLVVPIFLLSSGQYACEFFYYLVRRGAQAALGILTTRGETKINTENMYGRNPAK